MGKGKFEKAMVIGLSTGGLRRAVVWLDFEDSEVVLALWLAGKEMCGRARRFQTFWSVDFRRMSWISRWGGVFKVWRTV